MWAIANCFVLTDLLVELLVDDEKFVRQDLALAWKFAAKSMSGSLRAEARDALASAEISKDVLEQEYPQVIRQEMGCHHHQDLAQPQLDQGNHQNLQIGWLLSKCSHQT